MTGLGKAVGLLLLVAGSVLLAQSPDINRISPMAARPGETVTITLEGKDLQQPLALWTSFGARTGWEADAPSKEGKSAKPDGRKLVGKLTLAADAPLGLGFLRLPTATGFSGPVYFLVDDLPVIMKSRQNASAEKAQIVTAPVAIEGAAETGKSDFFRLEMKAGESVSVEVFAGRIGTKMDPLLRLLDGKGIEIASVDDTRGLAGDCRLRYRAAADGPLIIEIRDASFSGDSGRFYHLRLGDFPLVSTVYPPVAAPGETVEVRAIGEAVEGVAPMRVTAQKPMTGMQSVPVRFAPDKPAAFAYLRTEELPVCVTSATADAPATVVAPCTVLGRLEKTGGGAFLVAVKKDESLTLTPFTRDIGSPAMLYLSVNDEKGHFIAANDNPGNVASNDMALTFRAPSDGVCRVSVEDIGGQGAEGLVYGVHVERRAQGFDLTVDSDRFVAARGGSFQTKVTAQRRSVNGPITLDLVSGDAQPLPPGFRCEQTIIEQGKNETVLKVTAPADVPVGTVCHVRIIGRANEKGLALSAAALPPKGDPNKPPKGGAVMAALLAMPSPPRLLAETLPICIGPDAPAFFAIELTSSGVDLPAIVGKGSFVVRQKSIDPGFTADAQLKFEGLPPGVAITSGSGRGGRIKGQVDFICEVTGPADLAPGAYAFDIVALGELKGAQKEVRLAKVPLRIVQPLGIAGSVASPIAPGGKQKLKITATCYNTEDVQPINVTLNHLPPGITGPEKVTIAPGDTEAVIELAAEGGAAEGKFDNVALAAMTTVKGMEVAVESSPIHLEVRK